MEPCLPHLITDGVDLLSVLVQLALDLNRYDKQDHTHTHPHTGATTATSSAPPQGSVQSVVPAVGQGGGRLTATPPAAARLPLGAW